MRELAGLDFDEIGAAFESSPAVARQTLYEARLGLREMERGREMSCEDVMRQLSDADGRAVRRRDLRAHLRACPSCRAFRDEIGARRAGLAAIAPLPLAASAGLLHGILGVHSGAAGGGAAGTAAGAAAGKAMATSAIAKSAAAVAAVAVLGGAAADRGGLVDLPLTVGAPTVSGGTSKAASAAAAARSLTGPAPAAGGTAAVRKVAETAASTADGATADRPGEASDQAPVERRSRSDNGASPPGGGYGRSASAHGRPDRPPAASSHGQQTAAAHRQSHAGSPGQGDGKPAANPPAAPGKAPPPKAKAPPAVPAPAPPPEPSGQNRSGGPPDGAGPPGLED